MWAFGIRAAEAVNAGAGFRVAEGVDPQAGGVEKGAEQREAERR